MARPPRDRLLRLSWATTVALFLVLILGFVDTQTHSAFGCGHSWPLCHGKFIPAFAFHTAIEFIHRAVAGITGVMSAILAVWAWRRGKPAVKWLAGVSFLFVVVQALIGAADVIWPESAPILALHMGFALLALGGAALASVAQAQGPPGKAVDRSFLRLAVIAFVYVYVVVYLGAYVAHAGAAGACEGWPLCRGAIIPPLSGLTGIMFLHRVAALGAVVLLWVLSARAARMREERPDMARAARAAFHLILLQALSGGLLVFTAFNIGAVLVHVAIMSVLFVVVSYVAVAALPFWRQAEAG